MSKIKKKYKFSANFAKKKTEKKPTKIFSHNTQFDAAWDDYWEAHNETRTKLLYIKLATANTAGEFIYKYRGDSTLHPKLRTYETKVVTSSSEVVEGEWFIIAYFSIEADAIMNGWFGLGRTIFTCILITLVSGFFSADANELV